eukprot:s2_g46.t1
MRRSGDLRDMVLRQLAALATQNYQQKLSAKCAGQINKPNSSVCDESVSQVAGEAHEGRVSSGKWRCHVRRSVEQKTAVFQPLGVVHLST